MKEIKLKTIDDINLNTDEGNLLLIAMTKLNFFQTDDIPDDILKQLIDLHNQIYNYERGIK